MSLALENELADFLRGHEMPHSSFLAKEGDFVGEWRITAFLGRGAMGEVFRAVRDRDGQIAALKILARDDAIAKARFNREAIILKEHPHRAFPRFFDYSSDGDHPFLAIELLEPFPLPDSDRDVASFMLDLCEGVGLLHSLGIVHRDIKPENIMRRRGDPRPVLIDLGLVKVDESLSRSNLSMVDGRLVGLGTPGYSAPEQFSGGKISPAADIHALGSLIDQCFCGKPPRQWDRIVRGATSSLPAHRYATVAIFALAIRRRFFLRNLSIALISIIVILAAACLLLALQVVPRLAGPLAF